MSETIEQQAASPKKVVVDGLTVESHSLKDQIEADRYLKTQQAMRSPSRGLRLSKLVPPGAQ